MPKRDWGAKSKAGLALGGVACALAMALVISWGQSEGAKYQREADEHAREYSAYTYEKVANTCVQMTVAKKTECLDEARHERRAYEREEYDLVAQRTSALWTYIMGGSAVFGMILSAFGVYLVWATFAETREANVIARRQADKAERDATDSRNAMVQSERAILSIVRMAAWPTPLDAKDGAMIEIAVLNHGRTNAINLRVFYTQVETPIFTFKLSKVNNFAEIAIPSVEKILTQFKVRKRAKYPSYLIGYLEYTTIYSASFKTFFCYEITGVPVRDGMGGVNHNLVRETACTNLPSST
ncbi:hypothetical protein [Sphingobium sp. CR28]|uniref:hypothetical protein n=1 Tax=Sphingobium sp. CR28 TaxID=3400272 RepID=UPI003FEED4F2